MVHPLVPRPLTRTQSCASRPPCAVPYPRCSPRPSSSVGPRSILLCVKDWLKNLRPVRDDPRRTYLRLPPDNAPRWGGIFSP